jgi:hypothetical protein
MSKLFFEVFPQRLTFVKPIDFCDYMVISLASKKMQTRLLGKFFVIPSLCPISSAGFYLLIVQSYVYTPFIAITPYAIRMNLRPLYDADMNYISSIFNLIHPLAVYHPINFFFGHNLG